MFHTNLTPLIVMEFIFSCTVATKCRAFASNVSQLLMRNLLISLLFLDVEIISLTLLYLCCWIYIWLLNLAFSSHDLFLLSPNAVAWIRFSLLSEALGFILLFSVLWAIQMDCYWIFLQVFKCIWFVWHLDFSRTFVFDCRSVVLYIVYPV